MDDYAEHLARIPRKLAELTNLLNDKQWIEAADVAYSIIVDCMKIEDYLEQKL